MMKFSLVLGLLLMCSAFTPAINAQTGNLSSPSAQATWATQDQTRANNTRNIGTILALVGCFGVFVSSIYFIVRAFAVSATWGVCMLLFNGITILFFCLFQFGQARRPLGILLLSLAMIVGGVYLSNMGLGAR